MTFLSKAQRPRPPLLAGQAEDQLRNSAATTIEIYIFELFAAVVTVFELREEINGKQTILFVDTEEVCAALTKGSLRGSH